MNKIEIIKSSLSNSDACRKLGLPINGKSIKIIKEIVNQNNIDISHFRSSGFNEKYKLIQKLCPVCTTKFETRLGHPKEKTVCSLSCSNTLYRSGSNNGNWKEDKLIDSNHYRPLFSQDELKCFRCGYQEFDCSVQIHHIDENRENNSKENLLPLCANCHQALHKNKWKLN